MQPSQFLLPLMSALLLSTFGMPWLAFVRGRHLSPSGRLRSRWVVFAWLHPFWAATLRWTIILTMIVVLAGVLWQLKAEF